MANRAKAKDAGGFPDSSWGNDSIWGLWNRGGNGSKRHRRKDHRGFTLVELIVVIVILAILAAILVPGLLKWIDEAKNKKYEAEARNIYLAAEASIMEAYAWGFADSDSYIVGGLRDGYYTLPNSKAQNKYRNTEWFNYVKEMSGIDSIEWMRIYVNNSQIAGLNIEYKSISDGKRIKAWIKQKGYVSSDGESERWYQNWEDDGMWHFSPI